MAVLAASAMSGLSVITASKDLSACSLDLISVWVVAMSAVPLTWRLVTAPPKPSLTPWQRCDRPTLFCSWMTQRIFLAPWSLKRWPAARPATTSSWPTCVIAPSDWDTSAPELSVMIGMPADLAAASALLTASGLGTETASPSTFWETAAWISCASFCGSLFDGLQISLTPSACAAASAPFLTTDQNEPSSEWVTIAMVMSPSWDAFELELLLGVFELGFVLVSAPVSVLLEPPQAATNTASAKATIRTTRLLMRLTAQHSPRSEPGSR